MSAHSPEGLDRNRVNRVISLAGLNPRWLVFKLCLATWRNSSGCGSELAP